MTKVEREKLRAIDGERGNQRRNQHFPVKNQLLTFLDGCGSLWSVRFGCSAGVTMTVCSGLVRNCFGTLILILQVGGSQAVFERF